MDADEIRALLGEPIFERVKKYRRCIQQSTCTVNADGVRHISAMVQGSGGSYYYTQAWLRENGSFVSASCSCPYNQNGEGAYCKHIGALLMEDAEKNAPAPAAKPDAIPGVVRGTAGLGTEPSRRDSYASGLEMLFGKKWHGEAPVSDNEARRLLDEAGWKKNKDGLLERDGKPFLFTILVNQGNDSRIKAAIIIQSQLKALGITVHIRTVEWAAFIKEFVNKGHFDAIILAWTITLDPDIYDVWHSSRAKPGGLNFTGYRNAEVDELLVEARSMADQDRRKELYDRVQEILDAEQPYCFLYVPYALPIVQARFQGIKPELNGIMYNFDRWWVPKDLQRYSVRP